MISGLPTYSDCADCDPRLSSLGLIQVLPYGVTPLSKPPRLSEFPKRRSMPSDAVAYDATAQPAFPANTSNSHSSRRHSGGVIMGIIRGLGLSPARFAPLTAYGLSRSALRVRTEHGSRRRTRYSTVVSSRAARCVGRCRFRDKFNVQDRRTTLNSHRSHLTPHDSPRAAPPAWTVLQCTHTTATGNSPVSRRSVLSARASRSRSMPARRLLSKPPRASPNSQSAPYALRCGRLRRYRSACLPCQYCQ